VSINEVSGAKTRRVRVKEVEQEASYGPEEYGEEVYGDAADYLAAEQEAAQGHSLLSLGFVGFGLGTYNEEEDEDFEGVSSSDDEDDVVSDEIILHDSEVDSMLESESESESEVDLELESGSDFSAILRDSLEAVWDSRGNASFRLGSEMSSSSATPRRPERRQRRGGARIHSNSNTPQVPTRRNPSRIAKKNDPVYEEPQRARIRLQERRERRSNSSRSNSNRSVDLDLLSSDDEEYSAS
jgi:hypothetical protein